MSKRRLPFKLIKAHALSILSELDEDEIALEKLIHMIHAKVSLTYKKNHRNQSLIILQYSSMVSNIACANGWYSKKKATCELDYNPSMEEDNGKYISRSMQKAYLYREETKC